MMRFGTRLAQRVIQEAFKLGIPVGWSIKPGIDLHGAMDNFDHYVRKRQQRKEKRLCQEKAAAKTQL